MNAFLVKNNSKLGVNDETTHGKFRATDIPILRGMSQEPCVLYQLLSGYYPRMFINEVILAVPVNLSNFDTGKMRCFLMKL